MNKRASGILLPVRSLPSSYGIGDLGPAAYRFADFLFKSKQQYWQILPLNYPHDGGGYSPYSCVSAFAGNVFLISPEELYKKGYVSKGEISSYLRFPSSTIAFPSVVSFKKKLFEKVSQNGLKNRKEAFKEFCKMNSYWLEDFSLFMALKDHFYGKLWNSWPKDIRDRKKEAVKSASRQFAGYMEKEKFLQFIFFEQWFALKKYCNEKNIRIIGDMPIYVDYHSTDVWSHSDIFKLDRNTKKRIAVAGVPPDYFSATGQLWGNPVYRWDLLKKRKYGWWIRRMEHNLQLFDSLRIDHFRGFVAYWEVPAGHKTALKGKWVKVPALHFFQTVLKKFPGRMIIAEDLGYITQDVRDVMAALDLPGMKVLQFAFGDNPASNPYTPHNHVENSVVYTGTHDNNTVKGWFRKDASLKSKKNLSCYLGRGLKEKNIHIDFVRMALESVSRLSIIPLQDVFGLDEKSRINRPATVGDNWKWRIKPDQFKSAAAKKLAEMTRIYGRD